MHETKLLCTASTDALMHTSPDNDNGQGKTTVPRLAFGLGAAKISITHKGGLGGAGVKSPVSSK